MTCGYYNKIVHIFILSVLLNTYNINCDCCSSCKRNNFSGNVRSEGNGGKKNILQNLPSKIVSNPISVPNPNTLGKYKLKPTRYKNENNIEENKINNEKKSIKRMKRITKIRK